MPQLDGLRALAVSAVLIHHFGLGGGRSFVADLHLGGAGVHLFFVLSGFLITAILLRTRDQLRTSGKRIWYALSVFYRRRFLRLFPPFYTVLLVTAALDVQPVRETLLWHVLYLSNMHLALRNVYPGPTGHFWSLAVEEQFYLVWPWLVLLLSGAALKRTVVAIVALAPLLRLAAEWAGAGSIALNSLTPFCLDSLGLGAIVAICRYDGGSLVLLKRIAVWVGLPLFAATTALGVLKVQSPFDWAGALGMRLFFAWLVDRAAQGFGGAAGVALTWPPLVYLGKISYGIYVYHLFCPLIVEQLYPQLAAWAGRGAAPWLALTLNYVLSLGLAVLSWTLMEAPLQRLRRRVR